MMAEEGKQESSLSDDSADNSQEEADEAVMMKDLNYNMYFDMEEINKIKEIQEKGKFDDLLELRKEVAMNAEDNNLFQIELECGDDKKGSKKKEKKKITEVINFDEEKSNKSNDESDSIISMSPSEKLLVEEDVLREAI